MTENNIQNDSEYSDDAETFCANILNTSKSSFNSVGLRFLNADKRRAICALYAFCRLIDDAVDNAVNTDSAREHLNVWHKRLLNIENDEHPVCKELFWAISHFSLNKEYLNDILKGVAMDLTPPNFPDFKALENYCYHVASAVGLLIAQILGYTDQKTEKYAYDLGIALQLVNILRDVKEDQERHRSYIPLNFLAEHQDFKAMCAALSSESERFFDSALSVYENLPKEDQENQKFGLFLGAIYYALLQKIKRQGFPVMEKRVRVGAFAKLCAALRIFVFGQLR